MPIEMHLFETEGDSGLFTGPGGYRYTLKEDVYALAVVIIRFIKLMGVSAESLFEVKQGAYVRKEFINLLDAMLYPRTARMVFDGPQK